MQCQYCSFENLPDVSECVSCHKPVIRIVVPFKGKLRRHPIRRRLDNLIYSLRGKVSSNLDDFEEHDFVDSAEISESFWTNLRWIINPQPGRSFWYHNPWVAFLLSIIPGLGQVYKGERIKGVIYFTLWILSLFWAMANAGGGWGTFAWSVVLSVHAAAILDAFTNKIITLNRSEMMVWNILILICVFIFYNYVLRPIAQPIGLRLVNQAGNSMMDNDRVLINGFAYRNKEPELGDIVYYRFVGNTNQTGIPGEGRVIIQEALMIERIIGLPGDHLSFRKNHIWRNNLPLPGEYYPLSMAGIDPKFTAEVAVPGDKYFIYTSSPFNMVVDGNIRVSLSLVNRNDIKGKVIARYYPFDRFATFP